MGIYRSKAPFRISFAGGGTDIPKWFLQNGGQVISTTIDKYVYVTVELIESTSVNVHAYDLNIEKSFNIENLNYDGNFDFCKAVLKHFKIKKGCNIYIHSDLPSGSGMGTSSSLLVALISVFSKISNQLLSKEEIAKLACEIERNELSQAGGYQDQYASSFGGLNFIKFDKDIEVNPIDMDFTKLYELNYRLILCYTGKTHISSEIQAKMIKNYGKSDFIEGMKELKKLALKIQGILRDTPIEKLDEFGYALHEAWIAKKKLSNKITNEEIEKLYLYSLENGAIGGKLLGAGGGGHLLLFVRSLKKGDLIKKLQKIGVTIVNFAFEKYGVTSWKVN